MRYSSPDSREHATENEQSVRGRESLVDLKKFLGAPS
jgi:hypothetical protein